MKITRESRKSAVRQGEPVILFAIGPHRFAVGANEVDEIRDLQGLQQISQATARTGVSKVKFVLARGQRKYFVVDANLHFALQPSKSSRVLVLRNLLVAVLVDSIDRMAEIGTLLPLPRGFTGEERRWYRGLALIDENVIPVVNSAAFLSPAEQVTASSVVSRLEGKGATA